MYRNTLFGEVLVTKLCTKCNEDKPITDFPSRSSMVNRRIDDDKVERRNQCKSCMSREKVVRNKLKRTISKPNADYKCPGCERTIDQMTKHGLVLDHDHATGKFRGWICDKCNTLLSRAGDDISGVKVLRNLSKYLENFYKGNK